MPKTMETFVRYYLGSYAERVSKVALKHLARRLDEAGYTYCCFWAFALKKYEKSKVVHRNFIQSQRVWDSFLKDREQSAVYLKTDVGLDIERFYVESRFKGPIETLEDTTVPLCPVIRYAMSRCLGTPLEQFRETAIQRLREEPGLFDLLTKLEAGLPITKEAVLHNE